MTPNLRTEYLGHDPSKTEWVTVPDRDEPGKIINPGKNFGNPPHHVRCYLLHFPNTGEVCAYDVNKCTPHNPEPPSDS
ncbi:hypothetical protein [Brevibacterium yomogidense]|uniref:hypothetical protein n=1 Tax=Brevibacterium yomogidense TaxID=946573 RepID=UPI0018DF1DE4|nr:hypothetical protein [Brevibacterium yomogidense]